MWRAFDAGVVSPQGESEEEGDEKGGAGGDDGEVATASTEPPEAEAVVDRQRAGHRIGSLSGR